MTRMTMKEWAVLEDHASNDELATIILSGRAPVAVDVELYLSSSQIRQHHKLGQMGNSGMITIRHGGISPSEAGNFECIEHSGCP